MRTCEAAVEILRETKNGAVMWGDERLLHMIAARAGLKARGRGPLTSDRVLANLSRRHDGLVAGHTTLCNDRRVRIFWLPGNEP